MLHPAALRHASGDNPTAAAICDELAAAYTGTLGELADTAHRIATACTT